ncbi:MAG: UPF0182 family protein, partial [Dehalococcoidia bacterium]|nr:UPF0182 family protein [Dehalococcoidia bacterium]
MSQLQRDFERWFGESGKPPSDEQPSGSTGSHLLAIGLVIVLLIVAVASVAKGIVTEWMWFSTLGHTSVYTKILLTRIGLFAVAAVMFAALFGGNVAVALKLAPKGNAQASAEFALPHVHRFTRGAVALGTLVLSVMFGLAAQANWEVVLRFFNGQPFG